MTTFESSFQETAQLVDRWISDYWSSVAKSKTSAYQNQAVQNLLSSIQYSVLKGGKRFRPCVGLWVGDLLGISYKTLLPFMGAVEFIHTYSLIHDDLPSMDNDDFRRGLATNHKVFGEAVALLAGDALLTHAFGLLTEYSPKICHRLLTLTVQAAGISGMVGGQAIDMSVKARFFDFEETELLQKMKTGAMIRLPAEGAGVIAQAPQVHIESLAKFGDCLGLAFQIKDDLLDFLPEKPEAGNFATLLGPTEAKALLNKITLQAQNILAPFGEANTKLIALTEFNLERTK